VPASTLTSKLLPPSLNFFYTVQTVTDMTKKILLYFNKHVALIPMGSSTMLRVEKEKALSSLEVRIRTSIQKTINGAIVFVSSLLLAEQRPGDFKVLLDGDDLYDELVAAPPSNFGGNKGNAGDDSFSDGIATPERRGSARKGGPIAAITGSGSSSSSSSSSSSHNASGSPKFHRRDSFRSLLPVGVNGGKAPTTGAGAVLDLSFTSACVKSLEALKLITALISTTLQSAGTSSRNGALEVFLLHFEAVYYRHLLQHHTITTTGALILTRDISEISRFASSFKLPQVDTVYNNLKVAANLFLVPPSSVLSLVSESAYLSQLPPSAIHAILQRRYDFNLHKKYFSKIIQQK
jgi:hypothetical protein